MRLLSKKEYDEVWNRIDEEFRFHPSLQETPFSFSKKYSVFELNKYWSEEEEQVINYIFCSLSKSDIYALDWQHDCFLFNPNENIPVNLSWHDNERNCNVYFPTYYPDGDYHFFIAQDFSYGMLGHPWREELWVFGEKLIEKITINQTLLHLREIGE